MKVLDLENWKRKKHYDMFMSMDYPHFGMCANLDITEFLKYIKEKEEPFFGAFLYLVSEAANSIENFKYRIRDKEVIVHDNVSPSFTVFTEEEMFGFCHVGYNDNYTDHKKEYNKKIKDAKENPSIYDEPGKDDMLYITSIPWLSFTSVMHPAHMNPVDSFPRIAWGKYFDQSGRVLIPVSVQAHHALMDGYHMSKFYNVLQELLKDAESYIK